MKVKIGNKTYDANDEPIMIIFSSNLEKEQIANMADWALHYCQYPDNYDPKEIEKWMHEE